MLWTVGHSTRSLDEFIAVLQAHRIEVLIDVRRFPASRRLPWFNAAPLRKSLEVPGIAYHWLESLGGRRAPVSGTSNSGWRHASFRGYADHMHSEEFAEGLFELLMLAGGMGTAVMCAELLWWRCHRRLIADQLTVLGCHVVHIESAKPAAPHCLVTPAQVVRGRLSYARTTTPEEFPAIRDTHAQRGAFGADLHGYSRPLSSTSCTLRRSMAAENGLRRKGI